MAEKRDRKDTPDALDDETWFRLRDAAIAELREHNLRGFLRGVKRQRNQARKNQRRSTTSPRRETGRDWMHRTRFFRSQDLYKFRPAHIKFEHFVERTQEGFSDRIRNDPATFVIRQGNFGFVAFREPGGTMALATFYDTCCVQGVA
ncbi:hypothetical protein CEP52_017351 [Fusarium oligoseptatum]|uniref:Uncharacterized protein n=2 Tax=Fusarium solani species complex TaxID=232080 RepID=A0A428RSZ5_9HYPO|nr:hypothetical protein CEP52_017351 [Fusarium oligoseptatum]RSL84403.1 hypothetical protein CDV31_016708 [Fusarium ambrosium]